MGLRVHQQRRGPAAGTNEVIQALEAVATSPTAGSRRRGEKAWIRDRLARKRSAEESGQEVHQGEKKEGLQQSSPSDPITLTVRGRRGSVRCDPATKLRLDECHRVELQCE